MVVMMMDTSRPDSHRLLRLGAFFKPKGGPSPKSRWHSIRSLGLTRASVVPLLLHFLTL